MKTNKLFLILFFFLNATTFAQTFTFSDLLNNYNQTAQYNKAVDEYFFGKLDSTMESDIYYANSIAFQNADFVVFCVQQILVEGREQATINFRSFSRQGEFLSETDVIFQERGDLFGCGFDYQLGENSILFIEKCFSTRIEQAEDGQMTYTNNEPQISETIYYFDEKGSFE